MFPDNLYHISLYLKDTHILQFSVININNIKLLYYYKIILRKHVSIDYLDKVIAFYPKYPIVKFSLEHGNQDHFILNKFKINKILNYSCDNPSNINNFSPSHVTINPNYNNILTNLPTTTKILNIGLMFNKPLNNLPIHLTKLSIRGDFNQPINNLPNTLIYLDI